MEPGVESEYGSVRTVRGGFVWRKMGGAGEEGVCGEVGSNRCAFMRFFVERELAGGRREALNCLENALLRLTARRLGIVQVLFRSR